MKDQTCNGAEVRHSVALCNLVLHCHICQIIRCLHWDDFRFLEKCARSFTYLQIFSERIIRWVWALEMYKCYLFLLLGFYRQSFGQSSA